MPRSPTETITGGGPAGSVNLDSGKAEYNVSEVKMFKIDISPNCAQEILETAPQLLLSYWRQGYKYN